MQLRFGSPGVEVVGTLAAVDQVTVSSEADGKVSEILADLGDRVTAGQALNRLDNEKQQYNFDQQKAALARALAQYGAADPQHLPEPEKTPDVQKADAELAQAAAFNAPTNCQAPARPAADARRRRGDAASEAGGLRVALQNAKNLRANIQASEAAMKLADRQLRDT